MSWLFVWQQETPTTPARRNNSTCTHGTPGRPPLHYTVNALSAGKLALCFVSRSAAACLHSSTFFLKNDLSLLPTLVLHAAVAHRCHGFQSKCFFCPDSDVEFVYLVISVVSVLICIPSLRACVCVRARAFEYSL